MGKKVWLLAVGIMLVSMQSAMASHVLVRVWCDTNGSGVIDAGDTEFTGSSAIPVNITGVGASGAPFSGTINSGEAPQDPFGYGLKLLDENGTYQVDLGSDWNGCVIYYDTYYYSGLNYFTRIPNAVTPVYPNFSVTFPQNVGLLILLDQACCVEQEEGGEGCTPGFWKNHTGAWVGYSPSDIFDTVFGVNAFGPNFTLLDAAGQGGGGINALGRHAVAALLNATNADISYDLEEIEVIELVQYAVSSGDIEATKNIFAGYNEQGCPINGR